MGADRWGRCPRCAIVAERKREEAFKKAEQSYGKVDSEKYLEMLRKAEGIETRNMPQTLREDFSQGLSDDTYQVTYRCHCHSCGWEWKFSQEVKTDACDLAVKKKQ